MQNSEFRPSDPGDGGDLEFPARDDIQFRSLRADDLDAIVRIDKEVTGTTRREFYQAKIREMLDPTAIRCSQVAEIDGDIAGVVLARVDYGEFGRIEPVAVLHTINVHPGYRHRGVGQALVSKLLANLVALRVEAVRTTVTWNDFDLLAFLEVCGFKPSQHQMFKRSVT